MTIATELDRNPPGRPLQQVKQTWIEQGAWCAFAEQHTAICRTERTSRSHEPIRLARSDDFDEIRAAAFEHYLANPTHRVVVESITELSLTQPVED